MIFKRLWEPCKSFSDIDLIFSSIHTLIITIIGSVDRRNLDLHFPRKKLSGSGKSNDIAMIKANTEMAGMKMIQGRKTRPSGSTYSLVHHILQSDKNTNFHNLKIQKRNLHTHPYHLVKVCKVRGRKPGK